MRLSLGFLNMSNEYQCKENYLQHISEIINIKLEEGDTYNNLFTKLQEEFKDDADRLDAVNYWIEFNKQEIDDISQFETIIYDQDTAKVAVFNMIEP